MKKLFKTLSLLRLFQELRHGMRGHYRHRPPVHHYHGDHWHPRSRAYSPLYSRGYRKPKLKYLVRELLHSRRY